MCGIINSRLFLNPSILMGYLNKCWQNNGFKCYMEIGEACEYQQCGGLHLLCFYIWFNSVCFIFHVNYTFYVLWDSHCPNNFIVIYVLSIGHRRREVKWYNQLMGKSSSQIEMKVEANTVWANFFCINRGEYPKKHRITDVLDVCLCVNLCLKDGESITSW